MHPIDIIDWNNFFKTIWFSSKKPEEFKEMESFWDEAAADFDSKTANQASLDYTKKIISFIKKVTSLNRKDSILDLGCGTGILTLPLSKMVDQISAVDISSKMLIFLKKRAEKENITHLKIINKRWMNIGEKEVLPHDIVISHRSLGVISCVENSIPEIENCIKKINKASKKFVFIIPPPDKSPNDPDLLNFLQKNDKLPELANHAGISAYMIALKMGLNPNVQNLFIYEKKSFSSKKYAIEKLHKKSPIGKEVFEKYFNTKSSQTSGPFSMTYKNTIRIIWWEK